MCVVVMCVVVMCPLGRHHEQTPLQESSSMYVVIYVECRNSRRDGYDDVGCYGMCDVAVHTWDVADHTMCSLVRGFCGKVSFKLAVAT